MLDIFISLEIRETHTIGPRVCLIRRNLRRGNGKASARRAPRWRGPFKGIFRGTTKANEVNGKDTLRSGVSDSKNRINRVHGFPQQ